MNSKNYYRFPLQFLLSIGLFFVLPSYSISQDEIRLPKWAFGPFVRPQNVNPVLAPAKNSIFTDPMSKKKVAWEANDVFNPAATIKDNKIYVLYRAEDKSGIAIGTRTSRIGLAESTDGITMKRRTTPVMYPREDSQKEFEWPGGCEDPRVAVTENGTYVMFYTQWNKKRPRIGAATSKDLITWQKHGPIFRKAWNGRFFNIDSKSASIITKVVNGKQVIAKIKGKYWLYWGEHFVNTATSDDLVNWTPMLNEKNELLQVISTRDGYFDSDLTECGPPAITTDKGILLVYNGKNKAGKGGDERYTANTYAAGQVLFDLDDPTKPIERLNEPFFVPTEPFEKSGQYPAGTVFTEGLVYFKNKWFLYYGCADSRVAVAVFDPEKSASQAVAANEKIKNSGNPFLPGDFADPCILEYKDTFYLYGTSGTEATVWYSADFVNWKLIKLDWPTAMGQPDIWAPAVRQAADKKFYFFTSTNHNIYLGRADHPLGPFTNVLGKDSIFIKNRQWWNKMHSIDADCFVDDDGEAYLYWGSGFDFKDGICAVGLLNKDMASFKEQPKLITPEGYFEGPHMMKRNGIYYLMYSDGLYYDSTYKVRYATSDKPTGPFIQGKNSPILKADPGRKVSGPGHHYTIKIGDDYFIVYHRHTYPFYNGIRQICIEKLEFENDGSIKDIIPTQTGVPLSFIKGSKTKQPLIPLKTTSSSNLGAAYDAEYAFDGSYGTLWAAGKKNTPAWVQADFGKEFSLQSCQLFFDKVIGDYHYKIEHSLDNSTWKILGEGDNATAKEWPVAHAAEAKARYVRVTILKGSDEPNRVGLWEVKVFD